MTRNETVDHTFSLAAPEEDDAERYLIEIITAIQAEYQRAVEPYLNRLAHLRALKIPSYRVDVHTLATLKGLIDYE